MWGGGVVNGDFRFFRSLYLPNLHIHGHYNCTMYYVAHGSSLTPKWMTLNGLDLSFCVKIWFELDVQWVGVSGFRIKLFVNLQSYA